MTNASDNINKAIVNYKTENDKAIELNVNTAIAKETAMLNPDRIRRTVQNSAVGRSGRKILSFAERTKKLIDAAISSDAAKSFGQKMRDWNNRLEEKEREERENNRGFFPR